MFAQVRKQNGIHTTVQNGKVSDTITSLSLTFSEQYEKMFKVKEMHFKILHKIYPCKVALSKFMDIDNTCIFRNTHEEDLCLLFYDCDLSLRFWSDVSAFLFLQRNVNYMLSLKYVICTYSHKSNDLVYVVNFHILQGKYYIHKQKFKKCIPKCNPFLLEIESFQKVSNAN